MVPVDQVTEFRIVWRPMHLDYYVVYIVWGNISLGRVLSKIFRTPIHYLSDQQVSSSNASQTDVVHS